MVAWGPKVPYLDNTLELEWQMNMMTEFCGIEFRSWGKILGVTGTESTDLQWRFMEELGAWRLPVHMRNQRSLPRLKHLKWDRILTGCQVGDGVRLQLWEEIWQWDCGPGEFWMKSRESQMKSGSKSPSSDNITELGQQTEFMSELAAG